MCVCVKINSERNSVCHEVRCWDERGKRRKKSLLKFPVFPSCPQSILPVWPGAGEGQTMKWGRTRGSPHCFGRLFLPTLFCSPSLWEFVPPPLFLLCTFLLCIPPFCIVTCCRDRPPKKALLCSLYFQFYRPLCHSLAVSTVNISIKPALALCCALSVSLCLSPIFQLSIRAQIIQEHRHLISSEMTHWAHAVSNDASSCSYLIPRRKIKNCPAEPWV